MLDFEILYLKNFKMIIYENYILMPESFRIPSTFFPSLDWKFKYPKSMDFEMIWYTHVPDKKNSIAIFPQRQSSGSVMSFMLNIRYNLAIVQAWGELEIGRLSVFTF